MQISLPVLEFNQRSDGDEFCLELCFFSFSFCSVSFSLMSS